MKTVAFVWDNFGPMHADRCEAAQTSLAPDWRVVGIEQFAQSHEYEWVPEDGIGYEKVTLFAKAGRQKNILIKASAIIGALRQTKSAGGFLVQLGSARSIFSCPLCSLKRTLCFCYGVF